MKIRQLLCAVITTLVAFGGLKAHDDHGDACRCSMNMKRADSHAPISVMGDHSHKAGGLMVSYRYMNMSMDGLLQDSKSLSGHDILHADGKTYSTAPEDMAMEMHMFGAMYAPTDWITIMAMVNYNVNSMSMQCAGGNNHQMDSQIQDECTQSPGSMLSSGIGDISISAMFPVVKNSSLTLSALIGSSLPTGATDIAMTQPARDMNGNLISLTMLYPYPMQLGAGVAVPFAAVNFSQYFGDPEKGFASSYGGQVRFSQPIGENEQNWAPGSNLTAQAWYAFLPTSTLSISIRAAYTATGKISGGVSEPMLMEGMSLPMSPLAYSENTGRESMYTGLGANWILPKFGAGTFRLAGEYNLPVYQNTNGIQMKEIGTFVLGLQYSPSF